MELSPFFLKILSVKARKTYVNTLYREDIHSVIFQPNPLKFMPILANLEGEN